jgi:hypothetical protein
MEGGVPDPSLRLREEAELVRFLDRARQRVRDAAPHSPAWEAASAEVDDLDGRLRRLRLSEPEGSIESRDG